MLELSDNNNYKEEETTLHFFGRPTPKANTTARLDANNSDEAESKLESPDIPLQ